MPDLVFLSKEKAKFTRVKPRTTGENEVEKTIKDNYIKFLENIYEEVLQARTREDILKE